AIDAEPAREARPSFNLSARISGFLASLSPRALAWSAGVGAVVLLLQAGVIGAVLIQGANYQTASFSAGEHEVMAQAPPRALVRFARDARMADITALLDTYQASIIGAKGGMFRLQFGDKPVTEQQAAGLLNRLQGEKIVSLAVATP